MSDWKGAALVLQQLAEFRKPSQLDVLEKQYELQALANETEREYNNKVKTYDALKAQYDGLVNEKKTLINNVGMNADLLPKTNRTEDAVNVMEKLYNQKANDIDLALETLGGEIDFLQQDILNLNNINNAGSYAQTVAKSKNAIDDDGNTINLFKQFDNDGSGELDFEEKDAMFRFEAERKFPGEENQYVRDAFVRVGLSEIDAEEEADEKRDRAKEIKAEEEDKNKLTGDALIAYEAEQRAQKLDKQEQIEVRKITDKMPIIINNLQTKFPDIFAADGTINYRIVVGKGIDKSPEFLAYKENQEKLSDAGYGHLFAEPSISDEEFEENQFKDFQNKLIVFTGGEDNRAKKDGYGLDFYNKLKTKKDKNGQILSQERYANNLRLYEWLVRHYNMPDDQVVYNVITKQNTTAGEYKEGIKNSLNFFYDTIKK
tara:strand:+ start:612 stop:1904 length:1293 start_codon:yes stop_codon:yes gene_type:complete